ncbi:MAG: sugar ABC transporter ATP-binding protein [Candidatus Choladocola sp.]|nr:sugar ABC transporter ATP-binding protein [Candidatus Choladocola sp.]
MSEVLLEVSNVTKTFPGVKALKGVNLHINKGEIHGLVGENGAGKSTIIKILAGIYRPDEGTIIFDGHECGGEDISKSLSSGISVIYQELCLVPHMKVYENIMIGLEPGKGFTYSKEQCRIRAKEIVDMLGLDLPLDAEVADLDIAVQQMVEIAKAFSRDAKLVIMDEPTSSLTNKEVAVLYKIMRTLKQKGVSILFVSHKLEEVEEICDCVTIFRDGEMITSRKVGEMTRDEMVSAMVGREVKNYYTKTHTATKEQVLEVRGLTKAGVIENVSFTLNRGEVLGFTGLIGAGRTETMQMLFGLVKPDSGEIYMKGKKLKLTCPSDAVEAGIAMVPENRKEQGLIPESSVGFNMTISVLKDFIHNLRVNVKKERSIMGRYMDALRVKASSEKQLVSSLSGGNQQKVILGRWLATKPEILILDEPTRGIDIGAKAEIYAIIDELAKQGTSIILVSSELPEVINTSDRIVVMNQGRIVATVDDYAEFRQETIMNYSLGGKK